MDPKNNRASEDKANSQRDAAANVVRGQLDAIYNNHQPHAATPAVSAHSHAANHHASHKSAHTARPDHMQQYHNQWQEYYQKYYERYYVGHLHKALEEQAKVSQEPDEAASRRNAEEVTELKQKIVEKAKTKAKKARKSRHFIPIASAMAVAMIVAFLQYNQVLFANVQAYVSPGAIDPQNIVVDPTTDVQVGPEPRLIIPKINVDVPAIYGVGYDQKSQLKAMEKGVAHFAIPGANSVPGQIGNTVLSGHSSNDLFDPGDYKFIFAQLEKLQKGDTIYANYESTRYTYTVTKKEVVLPTQVDKLTYKTDKPVLTLITCTPLGTAEKRLLVTAEQVAPDPAKAKPASTSDADSQATMVGDSPTLLERLFGA